MKFEMLHDKENKSYATLTLSKKEAAEVISSLSAQMASGSPNVGRIGFVSEEGVYVDMFVLNE